MKIGCLQLNATVGDFKANAAKAGQGYEKLVAKGAELVVAPELFLSGYPPRDLLKRSDFLKANAEALHWLAGLVGEIPLVIGTFTPNPQRPGKPLYNSAAVLRNGREELLVHKQLLPTYDVFDEGRHFQPGEYSRTYHFNGTRIGITLCEDLWNDEAIWKQECLYDRNPLDNIKGQGVDLLLNLAASPWNTGKELTREKLLSKTARDLDVPLVEVNSVGGNDELLFDGQSMAFNAKGELIGLGNAFDEDVFLVDTTAAPVEVAWPEPQAQLFYALGMGTHDYLQKCGFSKAIIGLSGGIDTSVTAAIAVEALGPDNVIAIAMPGPYSAKESLEDIHALCSVLEIECREYPLEKACQSLRQDLSSFLSEGSPEDNLHMRLRGLTLMALSNSSGHLVLNSLNKTELAIGHCTLYGDMVGGLGVLSDVLKTQVYQLARWINRHMEIIPARCLERSPGGELRPNCTDADLLPPYDVMDEIIESYVIRDHGFEEALSLGSDSSVVRDLIKRIDLTEFKRRQAAPGLKVSPLAFGLGRRRPIAQNFEA